jgi:flagellar biosynthesis/type III secretory pathway M-ring protein FliF/YscJ
VRNFNKLALIVVMGSGFAIAQSTPASPSTAPSTSPSSTTQPSTPSTPEQQPSTAPAQGTNPANAPETLPSTDQKKTDSQTPDQNKMPQSDAAPAAANGDVQSTIQSAIQKDSTLSTASVNVVVNAGKSVELTGTVPSKEAKDSAERIAKENAGGLKIKNHLKIASAATDKMSDKPKSDMSNPK